MATVQKRGPYQWRVQIRKKGFPPQTRTFDVRSEADAWARQVEGEMDRGLFVSRKEAENTTLSEALDRYEREVSSQKRSSDQDRIYVRYWKKTGLAGRFLASIQGKDLALWRDERLLAVKPATVDRELRIISHLYTIAVKEWGMAGLVNPVTQIRKPKLPPGRDRRLGPGELEKILSNTESPHLSHIVRFALETAMRRGEIAGMTWEMVDLKKRTVTLPETKNGEKRIVPLSSEALRILSGIPRRLDGSVWGITEDPITRAFIRACKRAKVEGLTFHDLRHEATSRLFEKGFNPMEVAAITGHKTLQMLKRYTHLKAEDLAKRMDG
ncbi:MAG: site-specific integrase [Nitrospiraceae bacterium]|nr:site-specific integrase [Nitrospiraceae bacterium]